MVPKPSLVLLVREQLGGANTEIYKSATKSDGKRRAVFLGMQLRRRGEQPTIRKIAAIMDVQPSTISRWFSDGDYLEQVEKFEKLFVTF
jgi:Fic family protein